MKTFIMILLVCGLVFVNINLLIHIIKTKKELQELEKQINAEEEERRKKNGAKEKLHTGDSVTDFNNSIDVLSKLKKKK